MVATLADGALPTRASSLQGTCEHNHGLIQLKQHSAQRERERRDGEGERRGREIEERETERGEREEFILHSSYFVLRSISSAMEPNCR